MRQNLSKLYNESCKYFVKMEVILMEQLSVMTTKDNETLLFILNSFKKHQENKKSNAKKLIKEKK